MFKADEVYRNYVQVPREDRHEMLRNTATEWASSNSKIYTETIHTPINELDSGFSYYLTNAKPQNHYESIYVAMREYFGDSSSSGPNFFDEI